MAENKSKAAKPPKEKLDPAVLKASIILILGALASQFNSTMINVAIKTLTMDLNTTVSVIQWVITGFILAMGLAVPVSGWANKRFGGFHPVLASVECRQPDRLPVSARSGSGADDPDAANLACPDFRRP
ncbi:MFS transporter [Paenibacillus macerans]|uniref:MFS transporter n=1 Tax=Paenibacillus macerans TaxID=44252 RepID=UPI003D31D6ED